MHYLDMMYERVCLNFHHGLARVIGRAPSLVPLTGLEVTDDLMFGEVHRHTGM